MPGLRFSIAVAVFAGLSFAGDTIPQQEYRARREALRKSLADGVTVLFGEVEKQGDELRSGFVQQADFLYLTGWQEPGAILLFAPVAGEILFLPARNPDREKYVGRRASAEDANVRSLTGFPEVLPAESFEARLSQTLEARQKVYTLVGTPAGDKLKVMLPLREVADASEAIGRLRLKKSPREVELIRESIAATTEAHLAAWRRIKPGLFEYQVAAAIVGSYLARGCERSAYMPVVASGPNATLLHYAAKSRKIERGELVLIDAGAECAGYAADLTRTVPASGKFTPRQLELYRAVLGAQKEVIKAIKPGMVFDRDSPSSLTRIAREYLNAHGKDQAGNPLGTRLTHLVGHHVGLEVHDAGRLATSGPLEAGMVITIEPGVYIEEEATGIRIEDMVLVTGNGAEVLSSALPKEPEEIERALSR
jgi:Xaa-Pro aminopeptidase